MSLAPLEAVFFPAAGHHDQLEADSSRSERLFNQLAGDRERTVTLEGIGQAAGVHHLPSNNLSGATRAGKGGDQQ